jgi:hypothetical protein
MAKYVYAAYVYPRYLFSPDEEDEIGKFLSSKLPEYKIGTPFSVSIGQFVDSLNKSLKEAVAEIEAKYNVKERIPPLLEKWKTGIKPELKKIPEYATLPEARGIPLKELKTGVVIITNADGEYDVEQYLSWYTDYNDTVYTCKRWRFPWFDIISDPPASSSSSDSGSKSSLGSSSKDDSLGKLFLLTLLLLGAYAVFKD